MPTVAWYLHINYGKSQVQRQGFENNSVIDQLMQNERKRTVTLIPDKINPDSFKLNEELTHSILIYAANDRVFPGWILSKSK